MLSSLFVLLFYYFVGLGLEAEGPLFHRFFCLSFFYFFFLWAVVVNVVIGFFIFSSFSLSGCLSAGAEADIKVEKPDRRVF